MAEGPHPLTEDLQEGVWHNLITQTNTPVTPATSLSSSSDESSLVLGSLSTRLTTFSRPLSPSFRSCDISYDGIFDDGFKPLIVGRRLTCNGVCRM